MKKLKKRTDLKDIQNTLNHFEELSSYFHEKYAEIGEIWKNSNGIEDKLEDIRDGMEGLNEFINLMEALYRKSRTLANTYADQFANILYYKYSPNLREYVSRIREFSQRDVGEDEIFLKEFEKEIETKGTYGLSSSLIKCNADIHRSLLSKLKKIEGDLCAIEKSERYAHENVEKAGSKRDKTTSEIISVPSGVWSDVEISFISGNEIQIRAGDRKLKRTFFQLNWTGNSHTQPSEIWEFMFKMAKNSGACQREADDDNQKKRISLLNKKLMELFEIKRKAIICRERKTYRTEFKLTSQC